MFELPLFVFGVTPLPAPPGTLSVGHCGGAHGQTGGQSNRS
jgi:hypothetical protein